MPETEELYTNQDMNFDIFTQKVDIKKSYYTSDDSFSPIFNPAYQFLYSLLPAGQTFIWCHDDPNFWDSEKQQPYRSYILDIPIDQILVIDSEIWDTILNNGYYYSEELYNQFEDLYGPDDAYDKLIVRLESIHGEPKNTWGDLIVKHENMKKNHGYEFLIPSPVDKKYLVRSFKVYPEN